MTFSWTRKQNKCFHGKHCFILFTPVCTALLLVPFMFSISGKSVLPLLPYFHLCIAVSLPTHLSRLSLTAVTYVCRTSLLLPRGSAASAFSSYSVADFGYKSLKSEWRKQDEKSCNNMLQKWILTNFNFVSKEWNLPRPVLQFYRSHAHALYMFVSCFNLSLFKKNCSFITSVHLTWICYYYYYFYHGI